MPTKFFYMDEHYADPMTHRPGHGMLRRPAASLTGVTVPLDIHREFRQRYYHCVAEAVGQLDGALLALPIVHAAKLFPGVEDAKKFAFLESIVSMVLEFKFTVYRVGYYETPEVMQMVGSRQGLVGLCFSSLLHCLTEELATNELWPVMETDRSNDQDRSFAGHIQAIDYFTALVGSANMSVDNSNLGEMLYSTKKSSYGSVADIVSYLLEARTTKLAGITLSDFKTRLAEIADALIPAVAFDEIIDLKSEDAPPVYEGKGPFRYAPPIVPVGGPGVAT